MLWYLKNYPRDGKKSLENINLWTKQQLKVWVEIRNVFKSFNFKLFSITWLMGTRLNICGKLFFLWNIFSQSAYFWQLLALFFFPGPGYPNLLLPQNSTGTMTHNWVRVKTSIVVMASAIFLFFCLIHT